MAKGEMSTGLKILQDGKKRLLKDGNIFFYLQCEYILGTIFTQLAINTEPVSLSKMARNIGFVVKNVPFARKKAEAHFKKVIALAQKMGAKTMLGNAYLALGLLYKSKNKKIRAHQTICEAVKLFEQCEADICLKQANEMLDSLQ